MTDKVNPYKSKVFCMAPWVHMHVWPNGNTYACCLHPPENDADALGNVKTEGLAEVWNGVNMRKLRTNMLNDQPTPEVCTRCYQKEEQGFSSLRSWMNEFFYFKHEPVVASTTETGHVDKFNLVHWDFRFSNLCNLKCRTCGHGLSSQWHDDFVKEHPPQRGTPKVIRIVERNDPDFWALLESIIPEVETIHFAGGEPLLMEEHYKTLELLHKHKRYDISIHYSTNGTILNYKSVDLLKEWAPFKSILLSMSLDGYGEHYDMIRKNGVWSEVEANLRTLKAAKMPNVRAFIHYTVSVLNVLHLPDFHKFMIENDLFFNLEFGAQHWQNNFMINPVISPRHYSFSVLTPEVKTAVINKLVEHAAYLNNETKIGSSGIDSLIEMVKSAQFSQQDLDDLKRVTNTIDNIRNEKLLDAIPEIQPLFK